MRAKYTVPTFPFFTFIAHRVVSELELGLTFSFPCGGYFVAARMRAIIDVIVANIDQQIAQLIPSSIFISSDVRV